MNKPENHFQRWSPGDDARLRMMLQSKTSIKEIARQLKRTPGTIGWRRWHLQMSEANNELNAALAAETRVLLPSPNTPDEMDLPPLDSRQTPIEMIERRLFWGLITITRFKYADDN
jgi:transposase-like protein